MTERFSVLTANQMLNPMEIIPIGPETRALLVSNIANPGQIQV
ncbi:MAG: hypothetical protein P1U62_05000 [Alteraurantiacibacter sp. bin_em_oilr2.035]|nr:hypothetical protein [Aurantiacibacter atlanticus]MDF1834226.1 hypothetical protein [Alteraurantiacibacter sp. bin_em_oilr2.035]